MTVFRRGSHNGGVECSGYKNRDFRRIFSLYLENDTRYGHGYRTDAFEWYYFQWHRVTLSLEPRFKVTPLFDKRYEIQTYRSNLQWNTNRDLHTPYWRVSFRMTFSDLAKYLGLTRRISAIRGLQLKLCATLPSSFQGHCISVADS